MNQKVVDRYEAFVREHLPHEVSSYLDWFTSQ